jgi:ubiquinone/menaquinone biosynthesis C-methylase UbiE
VATESAERRQERELRRVLFGGVAEQYDATRRGYPEAVVGEMLARAGAGRGTPVLEIGCGTGQLTRLLAGRGLRLTAIDISAEMARAARRNVPDPTVSFEAAPFEEHAGTGPYGLIVSATAFHWVDPAVGWAKAARLLRPGGWLALLSTSERYPEPLADEMDALWARYTGQEIRWTHQPGWRAGLAESPLFGPVTEVFQADPVELPAETVVGLERTRATFLAYRPEDQAAFTADLRALLSDSPSVAVVQETLLVMAPVLAN